MAVCVPLIFGVLSVPASQPINDPPGNESFGNDCQPPSFSARAPYDTLLPSSSKGLIEGAF